MIGKTRADAGDTVIGQNVIKPIATREGLELFP
jgi:hypothetical protein